MTREEFSQMMLVWMVEYYQRDMSRGVLEIYWSLLKDYSAKDLAAAFQSYATSSEDGHFAPKANQLIALIKAQQPKKKIEFYKGHALATPEQAKAFRDSLAGLLDGGAK